MTIKELLDQSTETLKSVGITSAQLDAQLLMAHALGCDRAWVLAHTEHVLTTPQAKAFDAFIDQRSKRTPIVHLTGTKQFYGLEMHITPAVLTPRAETESMVELAINYAPQNSRLIDIGTGCGAIAIAISTHRPDLDIWATEVSEEALEVVKANINKHKLNTRLIRSNLFNAFAKTPYKDSSCRFATVVANLPYLENKAELMPEVLKEPAVALFGGSDGLDVYREFFKQLPRYLEPGGYVFTESDPWQQPSLIEIAQKVGLKVIEQDYFILGFKSQ